MKLIKFENIQASIINNISELKTIIDKENINKNQKNFNFYKTIIEIYFDQLLEIQNQLSKEKENY